MFCGFHCWIFFIPRCRFFTVSHFFYLTMNDVCWCLHISPLLNNRIFLSLDAGKPRVSLSLGPSYVEKGKNITLPICHVTGFPRVVITWVKVRGNLTQARTVVKDGQLSIINAQKKDSGLYECKASNLLGHDSAVTDLAVVEVPHFTVRPPSQLSVVTNQNVTVRCQAAGDPKPKVT